MFKQFLAHVDTATLCMRFLSVAPNKYPGVPGPTKPHLATFVQGLSLRVWRSPCGYRRQASLLALSTRRFMLFESISHS